MLGECSRDRSSLLGVFSSASCFRYVYGSGKGIGGGAAVGGAAATAAGFAGASVCVPGYGRYRSADRTASAAAGISVIAIGPEPELDRAG
jgi:hypothetical protein